MSVAELKQARSEKIYELGLLYYNKAVDGMEMLPDALDIINDIRSRFGYILYLKQNEPNSAEIAQLDAQISADFANLGEICYGYYVNKLNLDNDLKEMCAFVASVDEQMYRGELIAEEISMSVNGVSAEALSNESDVDAANVNSVVNAEGRELTDDDFVMPSPSVSSGNTVAEVSDDILFESIDTDKIENMAMAVVCKCGHENSAGSKFCAYCGAKLI